ncbi:alpha/beta hydrolase [Terracoccus luteus]|uniref:Acetyl esterase n=1 Tax=Terracoccus luteus TaxID=53356 RepID=A0A839PX40_9MICO|nr:alpha/beta hydrolase [Terracoccus luteus]MBB2987653.1 acetyl esterase [Terracoccus luteus]MCP2173304.1 acetyl esterase [Terracoccus luteus]
MASRTRRAAGLPLRTRLLAAALTRARGPIDDLDAARLARLRSGDLPTVPPFTWVTGAVPRDLTVGGDGFTARDGVTVPVRTYRPSTARAGDALPVLVWFHGGGWMLGDAKGYDPLCAHLAHACDVVVLSVDYRRSPEHRAPKAVLDCVDAVRWATTEAGRLGIRADDLGVAGDSAGGNLAAVVSAVVRDEGGARIRHQALLYPATDATMSQPSVRENADAAVLTRRDMQVYLGAYLGTGPAALAATDPLVSPLHAPDHRALPPTLVQTADLDPLRDDGRAYARALERAGVPVRLTNYRRMPHGYASFPHLTAAGRQARDELVDWVTDHTRVG